MLGRRQLVMSVDSDSPLLREWGKNRRSPRRATPAAAWALIAVTLIGAFAVAAWLSVRSRPWRPPSGAPHFVSCTDGGRVNGWCAALRVPSDPRRPQGHSISLHVMVLPATQQPAAGALFYLEGGPGVAATTSALRVNEFFARVGRRRDLVMVDQRGMGGSNRLACARGYVRGDDTTSVIDYLRPCFARLRADPRLYTTSVAAADLETVRRTLGYRKIDLFGGSYGGTLAQAYAGRFPESVRSVVLDSTSLPDVRVYDVSPRNAERALDAVLRRCADAPACERAYPHSRRQLRDLLSRPPRTATLPTGRVLLRPDDIAWTVNWLSETDTNAAIIPFAVNAAAHGDYTTLATTFAAELGGSNLAPNARLVTYWEIVCSEPWAAFDPSGTRRSGRGSYLLSAALARARLFQRACRVVPRGRVPGDADRLRVVRAPVLLLAGGADPLDPAANLRGWRRLFPDGRLVVVPAAGHGTIEYTCVQKLVARFVGPGTAAGLDPGCVGRISRPTFVIG
jgi:pimeloyl-ACP methyl ester carboxylesterase